MGNYFKDVSDCVRFGESTVWMVSFCNTILDIMTPIFLLWEPTVSPSEEKKVEVNKRVSKEEKFSVPVMILSKVELAPSDMTGVCLDVVCHGDTDGNRPKDEGRT